MYRRILDISNANATLHNFPALPIQNRKIVIRLLSALVLLMMLSAEAVGQEILYPSPVQQQAAVGAPMVDHVTDDLNHREDAQRALRAFHAARASGRDVAGKMSAQSVPVGSEMEFFVHVNGMEDREKKTFVKQFESDVADIWIDVEEAAGVPPNLMETLAQELLTSTPDGSFNSGQGIIQNNNDIFGDPPDADGDGRVDILFYDIENRTEGVNILGFVWSGDLCTPANAPPGSCETSNARDVLYLDTKPLLSLAPVNVYETAAHEYQHLIHFGFDLSEETFVNEGLSEWAERANGYPGRTISYLGTEAERNLPLLTWRSDVEAVLFDYERASLFTSYLAERLGTLATGAITRDTRRSTEAYRAALDAAGLRLEDVLLDFHAANLWNDPLISPALRFSYSNPYLVGLRAAVPALRTIDGRLASETPEATLGVSGGGSLYMMWENVSDFILHVSVDSTGPIGHYEKAGALVGLRRAGSSAVEVVPLSLGLQPTFFEGAYESITLVAAQVIPAEFKIIFRYSAAWTNEGQLSSQTIQYDNGTWDDTFFRLGTGNSLATRFVRPEAGALLTRVWISPFYLSNFSNGEQPETAPRDLQLTINGSDGNGRPGEVLLSKHVADTRAFAPVLVGQTQLSFMDVTIDPAELPDLPDTIYVVYSDAGADGNGLVVGLSPYASEDVSFLFDSGSESWRNLWDISLVDDEGTVVAELEGLTVPIRAEYVTGLSVDAGDAAELPAAIALDQNYPNPFNPATSIGFEVPTSQHVRLAVYDVTGREVARLVDEALPAGRHTVEFDGRAFASGVYLYALETAEGQRTRKMLLVK